MASTIETVLRSAVGKGLGWIAEVNRRRLPEPAEANPYVGGIHRRMSSEKTIADLRAEGEIPLALDGRYLRIGPNPVTDPNPADYHWFTGDGMAHGVRIRGGKALWYRNRWIRSNAVSAALGEPPAPGLRNPRTDTVNTNIIGHAGRTWALVEAGGHPVAMSETLETVAHDPFGGTLEGSFSAHPHMDPKTGELHAICYDAPVMDKVWHVVVGTDGKVRRREPVAVSGGPSIHDCAITENYVLVFDLPVTFSMKAMLAGRRFPYRWNPDHRARIGLLPKEGSGGDIIWCAVDPCYVFHPGNAFETADGRVVVDVVAHETMFAESVSGPDSPASRLERWTVDKVARTADRRVLHDHPQEFPRYDERRTAAEYRFLYTMALVPDLRGDLSVPDTRLFKHDLKESGTEVRDFGHGRHPGEFVFVPRTEGGAEDEGWLIGLVVDANREATELHILNADDFGGPAQAVIHIPHRVPPGFHGNWVAA